jgi:DNA mismatch endonuclease (patch repair protein)
MVDNMTSRQRSKTMSRIRSSGNRTTELAFIRLLKSSGLKGWRRNAQLPGRPDLVFNRVRVAVFLDGCFWHGCPRCHLQPRSNEHYWRAKIQRNTIRDRMSVKQLKAGGWLVLRIWEHQIRQRPGNAVARLSRLLLSRAATPPGLSARGARVHREVS